ncbi:hypothetical protein A5786_01590 [Gordonia sp. 852002-50816_SCH5313054-a]|nr:hypothetical protein A5786_01590 [Gordonia sp. 852002-50816_SCH5313054-a]
MIEPRARPFPSLFAEPSPEGRFHQARAAHSSEPESDRIARDRAHTGHRDQNAEVGIAHACSHARRKEECLAGHDQTREDDRGFQKHDAAGDQVDRPHRNRPDQVDQPVGE